MFEQSAGNFTNVRRSLYPLEVVDIAPSVGTNGCKGAEENSFGICENFATADVQTPTPERKTLLIGAAKIRPVCS